MTTADGHQPSVNDLIRRTPPAAPTDGPDRADRLADAARAAGARNPRTVAGLLATSEGDDPEGLVRALKTSHPDLFRRTDTGAGEGQDGPAGSRSGAHPLTDLIRKRWAGA